MTQAAEKILSDAMKLTDAERADLVDKLLVSLDPEGEVISEAEHTAAWEAEIARRLEEIDNGKVEMIPWEQVRTWLKEGRDPDEVP